MLDRLSLFPFVTVALALIAVAAQNSVALTNAFAYNRTAILNGDLWRLMTGHLTHWSADHLLWDVVMFLVLGITLERRHRGSFVVTVIASATAIAAVLWLGHPKIAEYRGLSGIDSALFTHAAIVLHFDARRSKRPLVRHVIAILFLGFVAKIVFELVTGSTLFVDSGAAEFVALPTVHMTGGLAGALTCGALGQHLTGRRPAVYRKRTDDEP